MKFVKAVLIGLGCLALLGMLAVYGGGMWLAKNEDRILEKVDSTIGVGALTRKQCEQMEASYRSEWDEAVNNDTIDRRDEEFARTRQQIDRFCRAK